MLILLNIFPSMFLLNKLEMERIFFKNLNAEVIWSKRLVINGSLISNLTQIHFFKLVNKIEFMSCFSKTFYKTSYRLAQAVPSNVMVDN